MKYFRNMTGAIAALALAAATLLSPLAPAAVAQTYPFQTPTYQPTAQLQATVFAATGDYYFNANGAGASVRMSALSGTLVAAIQVSNDPLAVANASATWSTVYYLDATNPTAAAANSITANGLYVFNTGGMSRFRVHITTLSGGSHVVTVGAALTPGAAVGYSMGAGASALPPGTNTIGNVGSVSDYPAGATPLTASATGTTAATTATLAGTTGKTTYICGLSIRSNATAAINSGQATVTGVITGTMSFLQDVPANTAGVGKVDETFSKCIPASGTNQAIAVVSAAAGTGGVVSVSAWGYQL